MFNLFEASRRCLELNATWSRVAACKIGFIFEWAMTDLSWRKRKGDEHP